MPRWPEALRHVRAAGPVLGRLVLGGALPGVVVYLGLFGLSLAVHRAAEYMGVEDKTVTDTVIKLFEGELIAQQLRLLAIYALVGTLAGLSAAVWLELLRLVRRRPPKRWRHVGLVFVLVFLVHSWFMVRSTATFPQIYAAQTGNSTYLSILFDLGVDTLPLWLIEWVGRLSVLSFLGMAGWLVWRRTATVARRDHRFRLRAGLTAGVLVALVVRAATSGTPTAHGSTDPARPNVLLLAVDSMRTDLIGSPDGITPHIEAFAKRGLLFRSCFSILPRTFPAWATILSGQYPHHHGFRHMFPFPATHRSLPQSFAATLRDAGWRTAAISDTAGDIFMRTDFGFEHVDAPQFTLRSSALLGGLKIHLHLMPYLVDVLHARTEAPLLGFERLAEARWLNDRALDWLGEGEGEAAQKPFFLTVFYSAGHFPYASPSPWWRKYTNPDYRGHSRFHKETFGKILEGEGAEAEIAQIRGLFRGAVASSDNAIGELLAELDDQGVLANTIVAITADHGESIYERGHGVGHGNHLYGFNGISVPLVLAGPNIPATGKVVEALVRHVDIAPTLLGAVGLEPGAPPDGQDLRPLAAVDKPQSLPVYGETGLWFFPPETHRLDGKRIEFSEGFSAFRYDEQSWDIYLDPAYEDTFIMGKHRMLIDGDRKLLYIPTREGVKWEMYDPWTDPDEAQNLVIKEPERFAAMKEKLMKWILADPKMIQVRDFALPRAALGRRAEALLTP